MEEQVLNRRIYKRYAVNEDAFVVCHNRAGQIIDISEGGMAIKITDRPNLIPAEWETTFSCIAVKKEFNGLPLKMVRLGKMEFPQIGGFATQTVAVTFDNPSTSQKEQVRKHISSLY